MRWLLVPPAYRWRVLVPGNLNLHAVTMRDRDILNEEFEAEWKTHLETLSDKELRDMTPQVAFCGLFDRVRCATRARKAKMARRHLQP